MTTPPSLTTPSLTPLSLRIARTLLALAGGLVIATIIYITAASQDPIGAAPWLGLLLLDAAGFFGAWWLLGRDPRRAKALAVSAAIGMGALGVVTGFGAGMLSFPAASVGVLAAWAALLHPPTRRIAVAFAAYLAIGVALSLLTAGASFATVFALLFVLLWPTRLILFPASSAVAIYALLGLAASVAIIALRPRAERRPISARAWIVTLALGVIAGGLAVGMFVAYAEARLSTSARFDLLDPLVLGVVFVGAVAIVFGVSALRSGRGMSGAIALGLGAAALFMTFGARPAVTCQRNGTSQGTPLAWSLRAAFEGGSTGTYSGGSSGSGGGVGGGGPSVTSGELRFGPHVATYRCEDDRLVEFREVER